MKPFRLNPNTINLDKFSAFLIEGRAVWGMVPTTDQHYFVDAIMRKSMKPQGMLAGIVTTSMLQGSDIVTHDQLDAFVNECRAILI